MTLPEIREKIKATPDIPADIFRVILFLLLVAIGYLFGRLYVLEGERRAELRVIDASEKQGVLVSGNGTTIKPLTAISNSVPVGMQYVASRNGRVFHLPWCPGVKRIKEENKIWFSSREEALARGLQPAANCEGI